jgi:hypothetical protein
VVADCLQLGLTFPEPFWREGFGKIYDKINLCMLQTIREELNSYKAHIHGNIYNNSNNHAYQVQTYIIHTTKEC